MVNFFNGATYPFRALGMLLQKPRLLGYVVIPIIVNCVIAAIFYFGLLFAGFNAIDGWIGDSGIGQVITVIADVALGIVLLLASGFLLVRFGVVLGSPWYGQLSEELERLRTGDAPPAEPLTPMGIARDMWRALAFELKKLLLFVVVAILLLLLALIPVAGVVVDIVGWTLLAALISCLDFFDGPQERRRQQFRIKLGTVRRTFPASLGFGLITVALVSIPFVNLLAIPICVAGGTLFVCDYVLLPQAAKPAEHFLNA